MLHGPPPEEAGAAVDAELRLKPKVLAGSLVPNPAAGVDLIVSPNLNPPEPLDAVLVPVPAGIVSAGLLLTARVPEEVDVVNDGETVALLTDVDVDDLNPDDSSVVDIPEAVTVVWVVRDADTVPNLGFDAVDASGAVVFAGVSDTCFSAFFSVYKKRR